MSYQCPRCAGPVQRGHSKTAQMTAGLVGALFYAAIGSFQCVKCGKIPSHEFPLEARRKMALHSTMMVIGAIALAFGVIWLINTM